MSNIPVLVDDDGIRPAGEPDECFYCHQKVGQNHKIGCVMIVKRVKLRYSYEIEVDVPYHWDTENIEFHRNDSGWCSDNSIRELEAHSEKNGCLCKGFECRVIEISDEEPRRSDR